MHVNSEPLEDDMEIPPDVIEAKDTLDEPLLEAGLITGIDVSVRDEEQPDPEDLVLRVYSTGCMKFAPRCPRT
jgi:hypothetical protein